MNNLNNYKESFFVLAKRMQFEGFESPEYVIEKWRNLVEEMKNGYLGIQIDLENDLDIIREPIQTFLVDPELNRLEAHKSFRESIENLDSEFLKISFEHPRWKKENDFRWWKNRILKFGSKEYVDFLNTHMEEELKISIVII